MLVEFDIIRVINLPHRRDRRSEMVQELTRIGLRDDSRVAFFNAIRPLDAGQFYSVGAHGVYKSHLAILAEAVEKGLSVLILEDDCDFSQEIRSYKLEPGWQVFYGGYIAVNPGDLQQSDIIGAHMMGFSREGAKLVLEYLLSLKASVEQPPIDGAYVWFRRAHPEIKTVFATPPLGYQRPSRSDIAPGAFYNRWFGLRVLTQFTRQLRRALARCGHYASGAESSPTAPGRVGGTASTGNDYR